MIDPRIERDKTKRKSKKKLEKEPALAFRSSAYPFWWQGERMHSSIARLIACITSLKEAACPLKVQSFRCLHNSHNASSVTDLIPFLSSGLVLSTTLSTRS